MSTQTQSMERDGETIKQAVRETYAQRVAQPVRVLDPGGGASAGEGAASGRQDLVQLARYSQEQLEMLPPDAVEFSFACGNPLGFAGVKAGDVVLDIGSGAGADTLLASRLVGPEGRVIGLDMTPEMIEKARLNALAAGATNVEFRLGDAEAMPVGTGTVDWVISNCVINLVPDKRKVFAEVQRVLKAGGRVAISDIVTGDLPAAVRESLDAWAGCVAGAVREHEYLNTMREAGLSGAQVIARQRYDLATIKGFLQDNAPGDFMSQLMAQFGDLADETLVNVWSARIVAEKPR